MIWKYQFLHFEVFLPKYQKLRLKSERFKIKKNRGGQNGMIFPGGENGISRKFWACDEIVVDYYAFDYSRKFLLEIGKTIPSTIERIVVRL